MKNIALIGAGGVGTIVALTLTESKKANVTCVVRSDYKKVTQDGWSIDSIDYGQLSSWKPHRIVPSIEEAAKHAPYDYIVVCTKFIPELQKIEDVIEPLVTKGTGIVLIQNGIGNEEPVAKRFPEAYVIGGISMIGSTNYHGTIKQTGPDSVTFGTFDERPEAIASAKELASIYDTSKSKGLFTEELQYKRWVKLVYNSAFNTICALTDLDTGRMYFANMWDTVILDAMKEVRAIAEADLGRELPEGIEEFMLHSDGGVYYTPSMQVDVRKEQPIELEAILGNPLRYAAKYNIPAPTLKVIYCCLRGVQLRLLEKRGLFQLPEVYDYKTDKKVFDSVPWNE